MDTTRERALHALRLENEDPENIAPTKWWRHKAMKLQGCMRHLKLVEDIKGSVEHLPQPIPLRTLSKDESDQEGSGDKSKKRKRPNCGDPLPIM